MGVEYVKFYHPTWRRWVVYARDPETKVWRYRVREFSKVEFTKYYEYISRKPRWSRHIEARVEVWLDDHEDPEEYWDKAEKWADDCVEYYYPGLYDHLTEHKEGYEVVETKDALEVDLEEVETVRVTLLDKRRLKKYEHACTYSKSE